MTLFTVTNLNDSGAGSLRQAILDANALAGADTIDFAAAITGGTTAGVDDGVITLGGTELLITSDLTIDGDVDGDDAADITISGNNASRVVNVNGGTSTLDALTITQGSTTAFNRGAGLAVQIGANATVINSSITDNTVTSGSAVEFIVAAP